MPQRATGLALVSTSCPPPPLVGVSQRSREDSGTTYHEVRISGITQPSSLQKSLLLSVLPILGSANPSTVPSSGWTHHSSDPSANSTASQPASEFRSGAGSAGAPGLPFNFPGQSQSNGTTTEHPVTVQGDDYLLPPSSPSRTRSKSDTSVRPSQWNFNQPQNSSHHLELDSSNVGGSRPVQMNEVLPPLDIIQRPSSSASAIQTSFSSGSIPHPVPFAHTTSQGNPSSFLSPDFAVSLRRARSDGGGGPRLTHRQSRSEDLRMLSPHPGSSIPTFPPSRHVDFLAQQQRGSQFLHPPDIPPFVRGHHRRASSGSRERGSMAGPAWGAVRSSPYPASPSSSPARHAVDLPDTGLGSGQTPLINNVTGEMGGGYVDAYPHEPRGSMPVSRPNVTTTATADASMKRRINDAKFQCPVPGCGSTFTRHFNLKGKLFADALGCCHSYYVFQGIYALIMMRSPSTASGQGVVRASHDSMTASATSNYTRIIAHSYAMVAGSRLRGLMPSIVIVRCIPQFAVDLPILSRLHFFSAF
jgi:hypothetical protein